MSRPTFNWKLPTAIETRLGSTSYGSQRAIHEEDHLLLVLHEPPAGGSSDRQPAVFLRRPDGKWLYHGMDNGEQGLGRLLDRYQKILDELEKRHGKAETAEDLFRVIEEAIPVTRAAGNMKEALQAAREMVRQDRVLIDSRDRAVDIARGLEILLADARLALDYRLARNAEDQVQAALAVNRAQHKLNILAAWTLPLMTVAAVFGMNLYSGLEAQPALLFWSIFLAGLILGMAAKGWVQQKETTPPQKPGPGRSKRLGR
ncbi:MAG TPA: CorA family divalent cation transporter [Rhodocyclaceae bacterium]|nr:CorA family divalent cation transporter [Rhodocyclaceae bacterium]